MSFFQYSRKAIMALALVLMLTITTACGTTVATRDTEAAYPN